MGYDGKYGRVDTQYGDIPRGEPVIVFRAQDGLTPRLLAYYLELCANAGSPLRHQRLVAETLGRFARWQEENADQVKVPDSKRSEEWLRS